MIQQGTSRDTHAILEPQKRDSPGPTLPSYIGTTCHFIVTISGEHSQTFLLGLSINKTKTNKLELLYK